jgi:hypothetical protein
MSLTPLDAQCETVTVTPAAVSLAPGQQTTFGATVTGASDESVTWMATGGVIDENGKYIAGSTLGTFTVTATSNEDPTASDTATVTIVASKTIIGMWQGTYTECSPGFACSTWTGTVTMVGDLGLLLPNDGVSGYGAELECGAPFANSAPEHVFYESSLSDSLAGQGPVADNCFSDTELDSGVLTGSFSGNLVFDLQTGKDNTPCDLTLTATRIDDNIVNGPETINEQFSGVLRTNSLVEPCTT